MRGFFIGQIMSNYPQYLLSSAIAADGDKVVPPADSQTAGTGRLSQQRGWTEVNSMPIAEGGIPPKREDFNGMAFLLSQFLLWYQQGGVMQYVSSLQYEPNNEVFHQGVKYRCLIANGPGTTKGTVSPGTDKTVWVSRDKPSVLAGQVCPFYNCSVGGSDGRRLIPWGETEAHEEYVLCDGGTDGLGGSVPNLIGQFLLPSAVAEAGQTGGSDSATTTSASGSGTVGETVLTIDQIPAHTHTGSTSTDGAHTHARGTMNITGKFSQIAGEANKAQGCFYAEGASGNNTDGGSWGSTYVNFDASRTWSGELGSGGNHSHTMNLSNAGGGKGHTHSLNIGSHTHTVTIPKPAFYKMAFFVKLPE